MMKMTILIIVVLTAGCKDSLVNPVASLPTPMTAITTTTAVGAESASRQDCWPFTKIAVEVEVGADRLVTFRYNFDGERDIEATLRIRWSQWTQPKRYPLTLPAEGSFRYRYETPGTKHIRYELVARNIPDFLLDLPYDYCWGTKTIVIEESGDIFHPEPPPSTGCTSCEQADPRLDLEAADGYRLTFRYSAQCGYIFLATGAITQPWKGPLTPPAGLVKFTYPRQSDVVEHVSRLVAVLDNGDACYSPAVRGWLEP